MPFIYSWNLSQTQKHMQPVLSDQAKSTVTLYNCRQLLPYVLISYVLYSNDTTSLLIVLLSLLFL